MCVYVGVCECVHTCAAGTNQNKFYNCQCCLYYIFCSVLKSTPARIVLRGKSFYSEFQLDDNFLQIILASYIWDLISCPYLGANNQFPNDILPWLCTLL